MSDKKNSLAGKHYLLPIVFIMGILPLIVKSYNYDTHLEGLSWYGLEKYSTDFFNYYKHIVFIAVCVGLLVILSWRILAEKGWKLLRSRRILIPLAVYGCMVLASTIASPYSWFCIHGTTGLFETVYVLLGYCLLVVYCIYFIRSEEDVFFILKGWGICLLPMVLLGLSQISKHDFYSSKLGQAMILSQELKAVGSQVKLVFGTGRVYLSLYNPNYVGAFCALALPIFIALCFFAKSKIGKLICSLLTAGLLICLMGAQAKTAIVILLPVLVFLILLFRKDVMRHKVVCLCGAAALLLLFFTVNTLDGGRLSQAVKSAFTVSKEILPLEEIVTGDKDVKVVYNGNTLYVSSQLNDAGMMGFSLRDGDGQSVAGRLVNEEGKESVFSIDDERFASIALIPAMIVNVPGFSIRIDGTDWLFSNATGYQGYYHYSPYGKFTKIITPASIDVKGYEKAVSNRGYIWSRTIPLLKKHILLGSGPDTYLLEFPQSDYVGRNQTLGGELVSKPHNLYLQIAVQTGVVSLLAFLTFYCWYFISCLRLYWKHASASLLSRIGAAVCAATAGYMLVGLTTDSTINVAPLFWCLMGIGIAVNGIVSRK